MSVLKPVEIVAAVIVQGGRVLCVQRGIHKYQYLSHKWEFPGGKIEPGEDAEAALIREISEELCLSIVVDEHLLSIGHSYPDFSIRMSTFLCRIVQPYCTPKLMEHAAIEWLQPTRVALAPLDWAAADLPVVDHILNRPCLP